jgi:hypothetical protein
MTAPATTAELIRAKRDGSALSEEDIAAWSRASSTGR